MSGRTLWVFSIDLSDADLPAFGKADYEMGGQLVSWPLAEALGLETLEPRHADLLASDAYSDGLPAYLWAEHGFDRDASEHAEELADITGPVLLLYSDALPGGIEAPAPRPPLSLVATLDAPLKRSSDAAMSGRFAMLALVVLFAVAALMFWVAA
ncbi:MAG: hypothetical protein ACPGID_02360 [Rubricella sp.]